MSDLDAQEARKRADEARVAQAGERWRARSRRVKLYRRVLPIVILMLAGGALTWTVFRTVMSGVERKASESREIRLDNPMFHGQDAQGRSFVVGAKGAIRDPATGHWSPASPWIDRLLEALSPLRAETLLADGNSGGTDAGFSDPYLTLGIHLRGQSGLSTTLLVGSETSAGGPRRATVRGRGLVFTLPPRTVEALLPPPGQETP